MKVDFQVCVHSLLQSAIGYNVEGRANDRSHVHLGVKKMVRDVWWENMNVLQTSLAAVSSGKVQS